MEERDVSPEDQVSDKEDGKKVSIPNKKRMVLFGVLFISGLLIGSILSAVLINNEDTDKNEVNINEDIIDSDNDGISDNDEINLYNTDPQNPNDMLVRTGLLVSQQSLRNFFTVEEENSAILISDNEWNNSEIIQVMNKNESERVVYGQFIMKLSDGTWEIVDEDTEKYDDKNVEMVLESSVSFAMDGLSLGYGLEDNAIWLSFDDNPSLFNDIEVKGVYLDYDLINRLGLLFGVEVSESIEQFESIIGNNIDTTSIDIVIAESVTYPETEQVQGDIITEFDSIELPNQPEIISETELSIRKDYSFFLLKEPTPEMNLWMLLYPSQMEGLDLHSVVTFEDVVQLNSADIPFLEEMIPDDLLEGDIKFGLIVSDRTQDEEYTDTQVSSMKELVVSNEQIPISVDCYVLWTGIQDVLEIIQENDANTDSLEILMELIGIQNSALGIMMDRELDGEISIDTISSSIGLVVTSYLNVEESRLLLGEMKGVLHKLRFEATDENYYPLLITDEMDYYDAIVTTSVNEIQTSPMDHVVTDENQIMVELEGYLIGTTVKTIVDQLDDIPDLSFLKIIQYLPHDICVYQLTEIDENEQRIYSIPIIQIVAGQGKTYTGEYKTVQGWFNNENVGDILIDLMQNSWENTDLPSHLKDYMINVLQGREQNLNLTNYLQEWFSQNLYYSIEKYISHLNISLIKDIKEMNTDLFLVTGLFDEDFQEYLNSFNSQISSINTFINISFNNITNILETVSSSVDVTSSLENKVEQILEQNLTFSEISAIIDGLDNELITLNESIMNFEIFSEEHFENLSVLSNKLEGVLSSLDGIHNQTEELYIKIANQFKYVFEQTLNSINVTKIVDLIIDPLGILPPPPPGYFTFKAFLKAQIENGLDIDEGSFIKKIDLDESSFEGWVRNNSKFDYLDKLNHNVSYMLSNISDINNNTKTIANNFQIFIDQAIQDLMTHYESISNYLISLKDEINKSDTNRSYLIQITDDIKEALSEVEMNITNLYDLIMEEQNHINNKFSFLNTNLSELTEKIEKEIENKVELLLTNHSSKLISGITSAITVNMNQIGTNNEKTNEFFGILTVQYAEDLMSFINKEFWNSILHSEELIVGGFITVYSVKERAWADQY